ncbi:MAG: hypothetical protein ACM3Z4_07505 [Hyphomicrobiales bacterium]
MERGLYFGPMGPRKSCGSGGSCGKRLHADDLVAHVQQHEVWDVLSFPAIAEQDKTYDALRPQAFPSKD